MEQISGQLFQKIFIYQEYVSEMVALGEIMMSIFALDLNLDKNYFQPFMFNSFWRMQVLRFPLLKPMLQENTSHKLSFPGCLTLINLKGTQVFQVQLPSGDWVDVEPNPGKLIVSIGEVLSYWTSQRYKTAKLQVINPKSTICIPFCFEPNYDAVIVPLHQHSHNQSFKALIYKEN